MFKLTQYTSLEDLPHRNSLFSAVNALHQKGSAENRPELMETGWDTSNMFGRVNKYET